MSDTIDKEYRLRGTVHEWIFDNSVFIPKGIMDTLEWKRGDKVVLDTIKSSMKITLQISKEENE